MEDEEMEVTIDISSLPSLPPEREVIDVVTRWVLASGFEIKVVQTIASNACNRWN